MDETMLIVPATYFIFTEPFFSQVSPSEKYLFYKEDLAKTAELAERRIHT